MLNKYLKALTIMSEQTFNEFNLIILSDPGRTVMCVNLYKGDEFIQTYRAYFVDKKWIVKGDLFGYGLVFRYHAGKDSNQCFASERLVFDKLDLEKPIYINNAMYYNKHGVFSTCKIDY